MLKTNNFNIVKDIEYPDHYQYSIQELDNFISISKNLDCKIITTEKDFMRIRESNYDKIKYIKVDLKILNEKKFLKDLSNIYE
jgi:tetraacyldisaccharide 4'-kinase